LVSGVQPHRFVIPPPPQVWYPEQAPQLYVFKVPQLSFACKSPQFLLSRAQNSGPVSGLHPHTLLTPPPPHVTPVPLHGMPKPQSATFREPPQLSVADTFPQFLPRRWQNARSVSGVHPHTPVVPPPPQVTPVPLHGVPKPQSAIERAPPQLSVVLYGPQFLPASAQS